MTEPQTTTEVTATRPTCQHPHRDYHGACCRCGHVKANNLTRKQRNERDHVPRYKGSL